MHTDDRNNDLVHSVKIRAGKRRTYFIDIRMTKNKDYYITMTESLRHHDGWDRHKILLYKEDFNRFIDALDDAIFHVKTRLLPDYDFEKFDRQHEEWERERTSQDQSEDNLTDDFGKFGNGEEEE